MFPPLSCQTTDVKPLPSLQITRSLHKSNWTMSSSGLFFNSSFSMCNVTAKESWDWHMLKLSEPSSQLFPLFPCPLQESHTSQHSPPMSVFTVGQGHFGGLGQLAAAPSPLLWPFQLCNLLLWTLLPTFFRFRHIVNMYTALWPLTHWRASFSGRHLLWIICHICSDKSKQGNHVLRILLTNKDFQKYKGSRIWPEILFTNLDPLPINRWNQTANNPVNKHYWKLFTMGNSIILVQFVSCTVWIHSYNCSVNLTSQMLDSQLHKYCWGVLCHYFLFLPSCRVLFINISYSLYKFSFWSWCYWT